MGYGWHDYHEKVNPLFILRLSGLACSGGLLLIRETSI